MNRLLFDVEQFFAPQSDPYAALHKQRTRSLQWGRMGVAKKFKKKAVKTGKPKPALQSFGSTKPDASPTKTKKPLQQLGREKRQRIPTLGAPVAKKAPGPALGDFTCGLRDDGSFG